MTKVTCEHSGIEFESKYQEEMKWISVKDELPTGNEEYIVVNEYNNIEICYYLPCLKRFAINDITYWMPLPVPPK